MPGLSVTDVPFIPLTLGADFGHYRLLCIVQIIHEIWIIHYLILICKEKMNVTTDYTPASAWPCLPVCGVPACSRQVARQAADRCGRQGCNR